MLLENILIRHPSNDLHRLVVDVLSFSTHEIGLISKVTWISLYFCKMEMTSFLQGFGLSSRGLRRCQSVKGEGISGP